MKKKLKRQEKQNRIIINMGNLLLLQMERTINYI